MQGFNFITNKCSVQAPLLVHPLELLRRRARAVIVGISKHFGVADTHVSVNASDVQ